MIFFNIKTKANIHNHINLKNDYNFILNDDADKECTMTELKRCDAYAKMNNNQYYGIGINNNNNCLCYVMDELPDKTSGKIKYNNDISYGSEYEHAVIFDISNKNIE